MPCRTQTGQVRTMSTVCFGLTLLSLPSPQRWQSAPELTLGRTHAMVSPHSAQRRRPASRARAHSPGPRCPNMARRQLGNHVGCHCFTWDWTTREGLLLAGQTAARGPLPKLTLQRGWSPSQGWLPLLSRLGSPEGSSGPRGGSAPGPTRPCGQPDHVLCPGDKQGTLSSPLHVFVPQSCRDKQQEQEDQGRRVPGPTQVGTSHGQVGRGPWPRRELRTCSPGQEPSLLGGRVRLHPHCLCTRNCQTPAVELGSGG